MDNNFTNSKMTKRVYLVRHGETEWNLERRIQGHLNANLTENGLIQAKELGENWDKIFWPVEHIQCSDLGRAMDTMEILNEHFEVPQDQIEFSEVWRERCYGEFEGRSSQEIRDELGMSDAPGHLYHQRLEEFDSVETNLGMKERCWDTLLGLEHNTMVVTHGGIVRVILENIGDGRTHVKAGNCCSVVLTINDGDVSIADFDNLTGEFTQTIVYNNGEYPTDHWSQNLASTPFLIADFLHQDGKEFQWLFNPTDGQSLRTIISLVDSKDPQSVQNRQHTFAERLYLCQLTAMASQVFTSIGFFPQTANLGNNSHASKESVMIVGSSDEPSILHSHIWGRGLKCGMCSTGPIESMCICKYIDLSPGKLLNLREGHIQWKSDDLIQLSTLFGQQLTELDDELVELGFSTKINTQ
eukprot:TRINITY_DN14003_c0_g2_i1.p1 TRINITY_DN14003_c0_g2~~TRINITY_DN14003_c0_g2_i1.p1  ORF type:complete len:413 (+),score=94.24 TRINITY_DN14003_c0_g2_i1:274-1512(+)